MQKREIVVAKNVSCTVSGKPLFRDLSFTIREGEQWLITGASGTGKSTLLKLLAGEQFFRGTLSINGQEGRRDNVMLVEQQHHFKNLANVSNFYYQQRFNSSDADDAITVQEDLLNHINGTPAAAAEMEALVDIFQLRPLLDERLIQLSNGENKRLQIARALLDKPQILLLDNPFIGLDTNARKLLQDLLKEITRDGLQVVMVSSLANMPSFITHVMTLENEGVVSIRNAEAVTHIERKERSLELQFDRKLFDTLLTSGDHPDFEFAVQMQDVHIEYHGRKILDGVNWTVRRGECWSLSGPNGAGKSTLLSLITADNPQAYANNIYLFDRKRGTGETIWEIKKKIGYVSPELHLHFDQSNNSFEVIASGLFDTIGLFRQLNDDQSELVNKWMELLDLTRLRNKYMSQLSGSEQRMVLLARALVKNPPMLVLDEPGQGLDETQVETFRQLVNEICIRGNKTLIYVSHYVHEIPDCVDKFLKLDKGRVV
jgi:molybdate transport system ATP-binding protein